MKSALDCTVSYQHIIHFRTKSRAALHLILSYIQTCINASTRLIRLAVLSRAENLACSACTITRHSHEYGAQFITDAIVKQVERDRLSDAACSFIS